MVVADQDDGVGQGSTWAEMAYPPASVSLTPFRFRSVTFSSPHRLSSNFTHLGKPVSCARKLAWVSLQGRLVNAEEASSARSIKGGLSLEEAVSWHLFTPIQRFLIVAVIGVAVAESKKNRLISQLKRSVQIRDEVLFSMQQKLDNLCEQLYYFKEQQGIMTNISLNRKTETSPPPSENFGRDKINFVRCGCWLCDQHHNLLPGLVSNYVTKSSCGDEVLHCEMTHANKAEQEERRMSDMSDWASSVTSTAEIQMNHFSIEQDIFNLRKESEEKDATIKELTDLVQSSNVRGSKRISELEDIIRRKNMMITRLKRDVAVLEQKVVQLTRQKRSSSSASAPASATNYRHRPVMIDNVVYDMDSTTSASSDSDNPLVKQLVVPVTKFPDSPSLDSDSPPVKQPEVPVAEFPDSSSDSDGPPLKRPEVPVAKFPDTPLRNASSSSKIKRKSFPTKVSSSLVKPTSRLAKSQAASSPRESSTNQKSRTLSSLRRKQSPTIGEFKKTRRRTQTPSKDAAPPKRWV